MATVDTAFRLPRYEKWKALVMIILSLFYGKRKKSEIILLLNKAGFSISDRRLDDHLRYLVDQGVIDKKLDTSGRRNKRYLGEVYYWLVETNPDTFFFIFSLFYEFEDKDVVERLMKSKWYSENVKSLTEAYTIEFKLDTKSEVPENVLSDYLSLLTELEATYGRDPVEDVRIWRRLEGKNDEMPFADLLKYFSPDSALPVNSSYLRSFVFNIVSMEKFQHIFAKMLLTFPGAANTAFALLSSCLSKEEKKENELNDYRSYFGYISKHKSLYSFFQKFSSADKRTSFLLDKTNGDNSFITSVLMFASLQELKPDNAIIPPAYLWAYLLQ